MKTLLMCSEIMILTAAIGRKLHLAFAAGPTNDELCLMRRWPKKLFEDPGCLSLYFPFSKRKPWFAAIAQIDWW